jgi:hypothetical protein
LPPVAEWIVVAPEYGNFAKLLKIEPIYDRGVAAEAPPAGHDVPILRASGGGAWMDSRLPGWNSRLAARATAACTRVQASIVFRDARHFTPSPWGEKAG